MATVHYILSFPAFGTWLAGPSRGRTVTVDSIDFDLPEPDRNATAKRRASLKWPAIVLSREQQEIVREDIERVASIRGFERHCTIVTRDHVHLLFSCDKDTPVGRLVQFIKGAPARALTLAAGDDTARTTDGAPLPHHKWWGRQYLLQRLASTMQLGRAKALFRKHAAST